MRALQAFLVVMGLMIVAGFVFVGAEVYKRATNPDRSAGTDAATADRAVEIGLDLPADARLGTMVPVGNRLVFQVTLPDGGERLYILNPATSEISAIVRISGMVTAGGSAER